MATFNLQIQPGHRLCLSYNDGTNIGQKVVSIPTGKELSKASTSVFLDVGRFIGFPVIGSRGIKAILNVSQDDQKVKLHDILAGVTLSENLIETIFTEEDEDRKVISLLMSRTPYPN
jgi:hypothetical protein